MYHYAANNSVRYIDHDGRSSWVKNESFGLIPKQENKIDTSLAKKICGLALIGLGNFLDKGGGAAIAAAVATCTGGAGAIAAPAIVAGSEALGVYLEIAGDAIVAEACLEDIATLSSSFASSNNNKESGHREKTRDANANDRKQVDSIAKKFKIDRRKFGDFVEETKQNSGLEPSDNFTYKELEELAKEFKELQQLWNILLLFVSVQKI